MLREIKFRAQDIASNKWLYGDLRHHKNDVCIFEQGGTKGEQVKRDTVGQFTGLRDKNGKEIYEGDIVHGFYKGRYKKQTLVCVIGWDKDDACFYIQPLVDPDDETGLLSEPDEITVIGTIYDNPELLGQTD